MSSALRLPPGPRGNPVLGSIPEIAKDNVGLFMTAWRKYGDIVRFRGPLTLYLLVHPDYVKHVLQDNHLKYPRPEFVASKLKGVVGDGLVANEGDVWLRSRRLAQPAFHRQRIASFATLMTDTAAEMLEKWQGHAERGESVDIKSEMMHVSLAVLAKALFKADWGKYAAVVEPAVGIALAHTNRRLTSPVDPQRFPVRSTREFNKAMSDLDAIVYKLIADRRASKEDRGDLVTMLIQAKDPETGATYDDKQIRDEVTGFLIAGHETVSAGLTWTWYLLAQNPESWRRVRAEVESVLGDRTPVLEDVPKLEYTTMVLQEAMRLYPPIFVLMRCNQEEDEVGGYRIPAKSNVVICPYVTHRHPKFWDNPEGFDPERFTAERSAGRHRTAYLPFAVGPRKCIGDTFAMLEMQMIVAMAVQRFRLKLAPGLPVTPTPAISLRPKDALTMTIEAAS
jgi:cytochrome P450